MRLKVLPVMLLTALSTSSFAEEFHSPESLEIRGDIRYLYTDFNDSLIFEEDDRLLGSYISVKSKNNFKEDYNLVVDLGLGQNNDYAVDEFNDKDNIDFELNTLTIETVVEDNYNLRIGRMFTPVGIYHQDPLNVNNFGQVNNDVSRYVDGVDIGYNLGKKNLKGYLNTFIGTRVDDASLSTIYGGNIIFTNPAFGQMSLGYVHHKMDGNLEYIPDPTYQTEEISSVVFSYLYDKHNWNLLLTYKIDDYDTLGEITTFDSKLGYDYNHIKPYVKLNTFSRDIENDDSWAEKVDIYEYGVGFDITMTENYTLYGEYLRHDVEGKTPSVKVEDDENLYSVGIKFNY